MSAKQSNFVQRNHYTSEGSIKRVERSIRQNLHSALLLFSIAALLTVSLVYSFLPDTLPSKQLHNAISFSTLEAGRAKCEAIQTRQKKGVNSPSKDRSYNPRAEPTQEPILLKNAVVWDGQGQVLEDVDVYIENGIIRQVEKDIQVDGNKRVKVIDVAGHIVSPGLVDMHSHIGVDGWPRYTSSIDANEMPNPITPYVRILDGFNPSDKAIRIVASGGITSVLALPGSANVIGGEAYAFKLRPRSTVSNEDMLVQANNTEDTEWRWMKMACGENPKRIYGSLLHMQPSTRLGMAYMLRKELTKAQALMRQQDDWCHNAQHGRVDAVFPEDMDLESLVALLRGQVLLNIHCYETYDIEALIRHSLEFNFTISAFHHALDAYRIPEILRRAMNNITIATFADNWGYTKETYQSIPEAPRILYEAGIPLALKSDHPVLNSQRLMFEAAKTTHYGLPPQEAFRAVTSAPADAMGLGHRIGSLKVGYDADIVIWDREPVALAAVPLQVFVDGVPLFDERPIKPVENTRPAIKKHSVQTVPKRMDRARSFMLKNAGISFLNGTLVKGPLDLIVENGSITCTGSRCVSTHVLEYDLQGGYILPGFVGVGSSLGLIEMTFEPMTGDGNAPAVRNDNPKDLIRAVDGIKLGTQQLEAAYNGGILSVITAPMSKNIVIGVSAAFKTHAESLLYKGALLSKAVALHMQIGHEFKSDSFPTVSSQINYIRQLLGDNMANDNYYGQAARGEIPTIITAHNKDEIASLIALKQQDLPKARIVIHGGTESYLVAQFLKEADIPVVLSPVLCTPINFDSVHCLTGAPLTNGTAAHVLHKHGVKVAVGIPDNSYSRNLIWDAGWLAASSPSSAEFDDGVISQEDSIRFITTNVQEIYGLETAVDPNEFVVYSGNPLDMTSRLMLISTNEGLHLL
ncbi:amidohydrolase family protein [Mucor ambiguus]|uniref:Amidohydrolase family protein n=1 Tax=Mucor ambiguus TaxID=91626 RepID=A0A0C9MDT2_9FUNG|nr:amidohydrolase family protein [Mucor ambiguus]